MLTGLSQSIETGFIGISLEIELACKITDFISRFAARCRIEQEITGLIYFLADRNFYGHHQCDKMRIEMTTIPFRKITRTH